MSPRIFLALILLGAACGGGSSDDAPDAAGGGDAIPGVDAAPVDLDPTPILERTAVADPATCTGPGTVTTLGGNWFDTTLGDHAGAPVVAYAQAGPSYGIHVAPLALAPLAVEDDLYTVEDGSTAGRISIASKGETTAVAWPVAFESATSIKFVRFGADGTPLEAVRTIPGVTLNYGQDVQLAPVTDGWALVWINGPFDAERLTTLRLADDGTPVGEPIDHGSARALGSVLSRADGGLIVGFAVGGFYDTEAHVLELDDTVSAIGAAQVVSAVPGNKIGYGAPTLLPQGDGWLAAFVETRGSYDDQTSYDTIQLVHLDASGQRTGRTHRLATGVEDTSITSPALVQVGDKIGLAWSAGTIIYICGGCMPDHVMRFMLLTPNDLVPASNIVELAGASGLFTNGIRTIGDSIVAVFSVVYHVSADGAAAVLSCQ